MYIIKNSQTCGNKVKARDFETKAEAETYAVNHILTFQNLSDHSQESGDWDIATTMRRCGLEIVEVL